MKLHKTEVARRQIDTAIDLFLDGKDYLSVVTLAGAGEEVLGSLIARAGKKSMIDHLIDLDKKLSKGGRQFKSVNQEINGFRNSLKHANDPTEDIVDVAEDQEHAIAMLASALTNFHELEGKLSVRMEQFYIWLEENRSELFDSEGNST
jgi:chromosome segregation ATPase